jgi:hypothetical protein
MSEDMANKEAIYLLRFEYGEKKLVSLEQPTIGRDYPMDEPMMEQQMDDVVTEQEPSVYEIPGIAQIRA